MSDFFKRAGDRMPANESQNVPTPRWLGPPENVIGVPVALALEIARTDVAAVWLPTVTVYPSGLDLSLAIRCRNENLLTWQFQHGAFARADRLHDALPDELLRYGVELADGRRATSLDPFPAFEAHSREPEIVLLQRGGHGGSGAMTQELWLWPLPPTGPLTLVVEWPGAGIALTQASIDAGSLIAHTTNAVELWPALEGASAASAGSSSQIVLGRADAIAAPAPGDDDT